MLNRQARFNVLILSLAPLFMVAGFVIQVSS